MAPTEASGLSLVFCPSESFASSFASRRKSSLWRLSIQQGCDVVFCLVGTLSDELHNRGIASFFVARGGAVRIRPQDLTKIDADVLVQSLLGKRGCRRGAMPSLSSLTGRATRAPPKANEGHSSVDRFKLLPRDCVLYEGLCTVFADPNDAATCSSP